MKTQVFGPLDIENLWKAVNKIRLQAHVAPRGNEILAICFLGSEYFAYTFNQPFHKKGQKEFGRFFSHPGYIFGKILEL